MIYGEKIFLRLMENEDIPYKVKWINDPKIRRTLNFEYPISEVGTRKWLNQVAGNSSRKDFIVCDKDDGRPIGYCGLIGIDIRASKAESYMGIGELDYHGKGIGYDIRKTLLNYAFDELNLNKVYAYVWEHNKAMKKLNEKVGFQVEGLLREDVMSHGERRNRYYMGLLKSEYKR